MWVYNQRTGELKLDRGALIGMGYSGSGVGKNNPFTDDHPGVGPIPRGVYTIGAAQDTTSHGPVVMALTPDPANQMYGRSGFLIHGDSMVHPGAASLGCIVLPRDVREQIAAHPDKRLVVIVP